jgi:GDP-L-fucose synthase
MRDFIFNNKKIFIAGHNGRMGKIILKRLKKYNCKILIPNKRIDYTRQQDVENFIAINKPDLVILSAASVGGIKENSEKFIKFIYNNTMIQNNIINSSYNNSVKKLVFISSSCVYPKNCKQPMKEKDILTGLLEPTNELYSLSKIVGIKLCQAYRKEKGSNYISVIPTNLYGGEDNFSIETGHVVPALFEKFNLAIKNNINTVEVWGSGQVYRELLHVDDFVDALILTIEKYNDYDPINIGFGSDIKIKDLATNIAKIFNFKGRIIYNDKMPDGMKKKLLDSKKIKLLGWGPKKTLDVGLKEIYENFFNN